MPDRNELRRIRERDLTEGLPVAWEAVERGKAALLEVPFLADPLDVIYASDLPSVAAGFGVRGFQLDRVGGTVTGLVVPGAGDDGAPVVIFNAETLSPELVDRGVVDPVHLFRHEGWHVVLNERGEQGDLIYRRLAENGGDPLLIHMATEAVVEYRAELACCSQSGKVLPHRMNTLDGLLVDLEEGMSRAGAVLEADREEDWHTGLRNLLHDLFNSLGHLAAEQEAGLTGARMTQDDAWRRLVGEHWQPFVSVLSDARPASQKMVAVALDELVYRMADVLREWMRDGLGVIFEVLPSEVPNAHLVHLDFDVVRLGPLDDG